MSIKKFNEYCHELFNKTIHGKTIIDTMLPTVPLSDYCLSGHRYNSLDVGLNDAGDGVRLVDHGKLYYEGLPSEAGSVKLQYVIPTGNRVKRESSKRDEERLKFSTTKERVEQMIIKKLYPEWVERRKSSLNRRFTNMKEYLFELEKAHAVLIMSREEKVAFEKAEAQRKWEYDNAPEWHFNED